MDRTLTCSAGVIVVAGMRVQIASLSSRSSLLSALLLCIVLQGLLVPPARLDIFGNIALQYQLGASLDSVGTGGRIAITHACNGRLRLCRGRMMSTHARKVLHVRSLVFGVSYLHVAAWLAEPARFSSDQPVPPPTPPPRLPA